MKPFLSVLFFLFGCLGLNAGNRDFVNLNELHGTSYTNAFSICKDANGFIWSSSRSEVFRNSMDGSKRYDLPSISSDVVHVKLVYRDACLVAFSNNGLIYKYNEVLDRFEFVFNFRKAISNVHAAVYVIDIDQNKDLYIAGTAGLYRYTSSKQLVKLIHTPIQQARRYQSTLFLATKDGLLLFNCESGKVERQIPRLKPDSWEVSRMFFDPVKQVLWIGTFTHGVFKYQTINHHLQPVSIVGLPKDPILAIEANTDSTLLFGVDGKGLFEVDSYHRIVAVYAEDLDNPRSLKGNGVYDLLLDKASEKIWVATVTGGVSFKNQQQSSVMQLHHQYGHANSLQSNQINKIIEDKRGYVWFATNNGVSRWDRLNNSWKTFYHTSSNQTTVFLSLCEDKLGRIWCGTYASGIYVIDPLSGKELVHYSTKSGYESANDFVFDLYPDSKGDIWIGGNRGPILCYLFEKGVFKKYQSRSVVAFSEYSPTQMLAASANGLIMIDKQSGAIKQLTKGQMANDLVVKGTDVWLCTAGSGLLKYSMKTGRETFITTKMGLPSDHISGIYEHQGFIWAGTIGGLCRIQPNNLNIEVLTIPFIMTMPSFSQGHCLLKNGSFVWGSNQGAWVFKPTAQVLKPPKANLYISDFKISGKSVRQIPEFQLDAPINQMVGLELTYKHSNFSMEVVSPGLAKNRAKYSWKLDGYDEDWTEIANWNTVSYTNIPPGVYRLQVRLFGQSLVHPLLTRSFLISIEPPFWKKGWFITLMVFCFGWFIYFGLQTYLKFLKQKSDQEKIRLFTHSAHELRTALTLIKAPIQELVKEMEHTSKEAYYGLLALRQVDRLMSIATNLLDFQKLDLGKNLLNLESVDMVAKIKQRMAMFEPMGAKKNLNFQFSSNVTSYETMVDSDQMDNLLDNLISNAVKYSYDNQNVEIEFVGEEQCWHLKISDYGIELKTIESKKLFKEFFRGENAVNAKIPGTGIGLMLVKKYVQLHHGQIQVQSLQAGRTTFCLHIPKMEPSASGAHPENIDNQIDVPVLKETERQSLSILVVEDHSDLRELLFRYLSSDFEVAVAENGRMAWNMILDLKPDLVISDVMMPEMSGLELCKYIKSTFETAHIPVILLTALSETNEQIEGLGLGADAYITKPFDLGLLSGMIRSILNNRMRFRETMLNRVDENLNESFISNPNNNDFIKNALQIVQESISDPDFGKDVFASKMHISPSLLYKKLKALTDLSPSDFIKSVRLKYAMKLLKSGRYSITEVSELCGFSGLDYFGKAFKKFFGYSPSDVKRQ